MKGKTGGKADYQICIVLNGGQAEAIFRFISENDKGTTPTGIYKKTAKPIRPHCPEQIQLMNLFQCIGLSLVRWAALEHRLKSAQLETLGSDA